jgi:polysaccharide export outer membrane protein
MLLALAAGGAEARQPASQADYVVGPEDVVQITVFDEASLSGSHTVDASGMITFGFVGRVSVAGLTLREVEEELTERLAAGFLINPQVTVGIEDHRSQSVYVLGEVVNPGIYQHQGGLSLIEVLAQAGGVTSDAGDELQIVRPSPTSATGEPPTSDDASEQEVIRLSIEEIRTGRLAQVMLRDGDRVNVPKASVFFVTGQVSSPGSYVWREGITVDQAVALAGGYTPRGSNRGIRVRRTIDGEQVEVRVQEDDLVQPQDTVHIRPRRF